MLGICVPSYLKLGKRAYYHGFSALFTARTLSDSREGSPQQSRRLPQVTRPRAVFRRPVRGNSDIDASMNSSMTKSHAHTYVEDV